MNPKCVSGSACAFEEPEAGGYLLSRGIASAPAAGARGSGSAAGGGAALGAAGSALLVPQKVRRIGAVQAEHDGTALADRLSVLSACPVTDILGSFKSAKRKIQSHIDIRYFYRRSPWLVDGGDNLRTLTANYSLLRY